MVIILHCDTLLIKIFSFFQFLSYQKVCQFPCVHTVILKAEEETKLHIYVNDSEVIDNIINYKNCVKCSLLKVKSFLKVLCHLDVFGRNMYCIWPEVSHFIFSLHISLKSFFLEKKTPQLISAFIDSFMDQIINDCLWFLYMISK